MAFSRLKPAAIAALSTLLIGGALAPTTAAAPLPSSFATPEANMTTPNWSGLDVREPGALGELPSTTGVAVREVPMDASLHLDDAAVNQRYAHTTIDQHGDIALSTAAIYLPEGPAPDDGWPVLAWAHGTVGIGDDCTPSAGHRNDTTLVNHWVSQGYAVVASDYVGLGTPGLMPYYDGDVTAANVEDAVIAAHQLSSVSGELSPKWAVIGQSQGGAAALHVAHEVGSRDSSSDPVSELDFRGAIATGAPGHIETIIANSGLNVPPVPLPGSLNAYLLYILAGFRDSHPDFDIDSVLTPEGQALLDVSETSCLRELRTAADWSNLSEIFNAPVKSLPGIEVALNEYMATPVDGYQHPVFFGHGIVDLDVPSPLGASVNSQAWLNQFTGSNDQVEVHWYPTSHNETPVAAADDIQHFLDGIFT